MALFHRKPMRCRECRHRFYQYEDDDVEENGPASDVEAPKERYPP
jgi:hypothetical protein